MQARKKTVANMDEIELYSLVDEAVKESMISEKSNIFEESKKSKVSA